MSSPQVYLMYGFITAITTTFTMLCVTIQRRHLMVPLLLYVFYSCLHHYVSTLLEPQHHISPVTISMQVWGLFAPKFVFDVVGLLLCDLLIFLSALYYIG